MAQNNIEILSQMNKMIQEQTKAFEKQNKVLNSQLEVTKAIVKSLASMPVKEISDNFSMASKAIEEAEKNIEKTSSATVKLNEAAKKGSKDFLGLGDKIESFSKKALSITMVASGINAMVKSFKLLGSVIGGTLDTLTTMVGVLFDIGVSIVSAPFKWLGSLISSAGASGSNEFAQAVNEVRKEFGQLATNEAKAVMDSFRGIRGDLAETGFSAWRILGNFAERLQYVTELAKKMGPVWTDVYQQIKDNFEDVERMIVYQKGLGLTDAGIKALGDRSKATGKDFNELGREITTYAYQLGDSFGVNGKIVSRAVGEMMADVKNFGSLSVKEMSQIAIYTRKLGIEFKELQGVIDKFDNFEDAAEGAAQLSQAFGLNIDALAMMKEQDPAKRFEMLRAEFIKTGKNIGDLTRQERALLAAQTGLSDDALLKGFSKQAMSYDEVTKAGDKAEKKQLSQAEAMKKLSMSMDRMIKSGGGMTDFFDAFTQGMTIGITRSKEFREMFRSVKRALQATRLAGIQFGRSLMEMWPGVKDLTKGLSELFRAIGSLDEHLKTKKTSFIAVFTQLLTDFVKNPSKGLEGFIKTLEDRFGNVFNLDGPIFKKIITGAKKSFEHLMVIAGQVIKFGIENITKFLITGSGFLEALRTGDWDKLFSGAQSGFMKFILDVFRPVIDIFKDGTLWENIGNAFMMFGEQVWLTIKDVFNRFVWPKVKSFWEENWLTIVGVGSAILFGPAIVGILAGAFIKALGLVALKVISWKASSGVFDKIFDFSPSTKALSTLTEGMKATTEIEATSSKVNFKSIVGSIGKFALVMVAVAGASYALYQMIKNWPPELTLEKVIPPLAVVTAAAAALVPMSIAMKTLSAVKITPSMLFSLAVGIAALSGTLLAMARTFNILNYGLSDIKTSDVLKVGAVIGTMAIAYATATGVIIVSGLIGALVYFTGGTAALVIAGGLASLAAITTAMVMQAVHLVKVINSANVDESFFTKAKAVGIVVGFFKDIATVAQNFMSEGLLTGVIDRIRGLWGANPEQNLEKKLNSIKGFISTLMDKMVEIATGIELGIQDTSKLNAIGPIFNAMSNLFTTLIPAAETLKNTENLTVILRSVQGHISDLTKTLKDNLVPAISELINGTLVSLSIVKAEDISKLESVFNLLGTLFQTLTPSPELIKSFTIWSSSQKGDNVYKRASIDTEAMSKSLGMFGKAFKTMLKELNTESSDDSVLSSIGDFATKISNIFGDKKGKSFSNAITLFSSTINALKDLTEIFSNESNISFFNEKSVEQFFSKIEPTAFELIAQNMDIIKNSFDNIDQNVVELQTARLEKISTGIVAMVKTINEQDKMLNDLALSTEPINVRLEKIGDKLGLKDKSEFMIKRGDLNVEVKLNVTIDADDLEKALTHRVGSKILTK